MLYADTNERIKIDFQKNLIKAVLNYVIISHMV